MARTVAGTAVESQASVVALRSEVRSTEVDLAGFLGMVRRAVHDTGWGPEALSAADAMDRDKSYISRVLNGEKPLSIDFLLSLPGDVQDAFAAHYAERRGWIVARPVSSELAVQHLVSGLLGVLGARRSA